MRSACSVNSSFGPEPQSTASTLLLFEPGAFHQRPPARQRPSGSLRSSSRSRPSTARVVCEPHPGEHDERLEEVVVPERRRVHCHERLADRCAGGERPEEPVFEEELGGALGRLRALVSPVAAQYSCRPHIGSSDSLKDER